MVLKCTHLGKPPITNAPGFRNRIAIWADNNSVDHPAGSEMQRPSTVLQTSSAQDSRLSQPSNRHSSLPVSPRLFTNESGEPVLLPYNKETSPGFEGGMKSSK